MQDLFSLLSTKYNYLIFRRRKHPTALEVTIYLQCDIVKKHKEFSCNKYTVTFIQYMQTQKMLSQGKAVVLALKNKK